MITENIHVSIKGINKNIEGEIMRRSLAVVLATSMIVSLSACSKQPSVESVSSTNFNVSDYNKDMETFVNIVYNGKMSDTLFIAKGREMNW